MTTDPLMAVPGAVPGTYFHEPARSRCLAELLSEVQGSATAVVMGEYGAGKTTLLQRLLALPPAHWRVCRVTANPLLDRQRLLTTLARCLGGPGGGAAAAATTSLCKLVAGLRAQGLMPVLLVDDAHELSADCLGLLARLCSTSPGAQRAMRVVLFGEPDLRRLLEGIMPRGAPIVEYLLPPLNVLQTADYLQHQLQRAGAGPLPRLDPQGLAALHREARGLPGRIDLLAPSMLGLRRGGMFRPPSKPGFVGGSAPRRHMILTALALAVAVLGLGGSLAYRYGMPAMYAGPAGERPAATQQPPAPIPAGNAPRPAMTAAPSPPVADPRVQAIAPQPGHPADKAVASSLPSTAAAATQGSSTKIHGDRWLLRQNPAYYTLQIFAVRDEAALLDFVRRHRTQAELAYFHQYGGGKPWFVLVHGIYPDRASAVAALDGLEEGLQGDKPWPRPLRSVQVAIGQGPRAWRDSPRPAGRDP